MTNDDKTFIILEADMERCQAQAEQHPIHLVPSSNPDAIVIDVSSLEMLRQQIDQANGTIRTSELEEVLLSTLLATRHALATHGLLTETRKIAPVTDVDTPTTSH
jgi:hypothetical protein